MTYGTALVIGNATICNSLKKSIPMKTKMFILAAILLVSATSALVAAEKNREESSLGALVQKEIPYPEFAREMKLSGTVELYLLETEDGISLEARSNDPRLEEYVKNRVAGLDKALKNAFEQAGASRFRFTFRYIP